MSVEINTDVLHELLVDAIGGDAADEIWAEYDQRICTNEDCTEDTQDGEGYDGLCGNCADVKYRNEKDDDR